MLKFLAVIKDWISKLARINKSALGREGDMVRIRLRRQGSKGQPTYRIVVTDQRKARNGKYLENIGHYNPRTRPATEIIKEDRALYWLSVGAQPSDAVRRLMNHTGTWERFQRLRAGENIEDLVKEAEENRNELPSQKTNYPSPANGAGRIKALEASRFVAETADASNEPDNKLEPTKYEKSQNQPTDKTSEKNDVDSNLSDAFQEAFNRPGKTQLNNPEPLPNPLRNPDYRSHQKRKRFEIASGINLVNVNPSGKCP